MVSRFRVGCDNDFRDEHVQFVVLVGPSSRNV